MIDGSGQPRSRWWPVAFALQRINDPRAAPALLALLTGDGQLTRAFAARGLGVLKEPKAASAFLALAENAGEPLAVPPELRQLLGWDATHLPGALPAAAPR